MSKINKVLYKVKAILRKNCRVSLTATLSKETILEGYNKIYKGVKIENSSIGLGSYIGVDSFLPCSKVGRFTAIGPRARMVRGRHPTSNFASIHPAFYSVRKQTGFTFVAKDKFQEFSRGEFAVNIGNDVWIGSDVLILEGVRIGDGAVIGSGAVVSKDIKPYSINVGNPIKQIGSRFAEEQVLSLLKLKWWEKDIDWLKKNAEKFENVENLLGREY
ncbi:MAG: CatB-related O-acetyltransferase [Candidatus Dojkabacteria bacterium]